MTTTVNLGLTHLEENAASPEIRVNALADGLDHAMNSSVTINFTTDANLTLSTTGTVPQQWQYGTIRFTDTGPVLTAGRNVIVPVNKRVYRIVNNTAQTLTVKTSAGTGIAVASNTGALLQCDGTNVIDTLPGSGGGSVGSVNGQVGTVVLDLDDINDVTITAPSDGQVLTYDNAASEWVNDDAPNTTYSISAETGTGGANIRLTGSDASTDDILLAEGTNVTITRDDAGTITINASGGAGGGDVSGPVSSTNDAIVLWNGTSGDLIKDSGLTLNAIRTESFVIAASDETTALTTGTAKVTFRMPYAFTLSSVKASVTTAPTGATIIVDINESGTTILSTKLSIDATEKTSVTAATPAVISDTALAADAEMTIDIDQVGSTIAGAGLKITLIGVQA